MNFLSQPQNLGLIGIAAGAGAMLLALNLKNRGGSDAVSAQQATQLINHKNAVVVDVRTPDEFAGGSILGARNLPLDGLAGRLAELARYKSRPVIVVCQSGARSGRALTLLRKDGYAEVYNLAGGLKGWQEGGLPLVKAAKDNAAASNRKEKA